MAAASMTNSCRDSRRQRSSPEVIICMRPSNRTSLTRSQSTLISDTLRRALSNHLLSANAECDVANNIVTAKAGQSARMKSFRCQFRLSQKYSRGAERNIDGDQISGLTKLSGSGGPRNAARCSKRLVMFLGKERADRRDELANVALLASRERRLC